MRPTPCWRTIARIGPPWMAPSATLLNTIVSIAARLPRSPRTKPALVCGLVRAGGTERIVRSWFAECLIRRRVCAPPSPRVWGPNGSGRVFYGP
jgi:hypothetical protein